MILLVPVIATVVAVAGGQTPTVEVMLKQGAITGVQEEAPNGRVYYSFKSIPYAKPPVGPLRFKDPEPAPAWKGVRNGSLSIPKCPQITFFDQGTLQGQEDCLYLNVYTPRLSSNLPVMVYIHGGGFIIGAAEENGTVPTPLVQKDVVVVSINYRLGTLGFLSTGDDVVPGNLGLKDQVVALRWVQDNIMDLGGDPNQVTIFGISAGGMSVHYHILSPLSTGLFHRGIMQSGTALIPSIIASPLDNAIRISKALNCTGEERQQLLTCFMEADVNDLVEIPYKLGEWFMMPHPVGPSVDGTFLPDQPAALLKAGAYNKVDVMSGTTKDEGNVITAGLFGSKGEHPLQQLNKNLTKFGPIMLLTTQEEDPEYLAWRLLLRDMNYKANFSNITQDDEIALTKIIGDRIFQAPNAKTVEFHAKDTNTMTFMYQFDHYNEVSLLSMLLNSTIQRKVVGHGDDMFFLFHFPKPLGPMKRPQDLHMQEILSTLFTNFASTGNPTVNGTLGFRWTPVKSEGPLRYLSLTTTPTMKTVSSVDREFWNSLPEKNNKHLYPERFLENEI